MYSKVIPLLSLTNLSSVLKFSPALSHLMCLTFLPVAASISSTNKLITSASSSLKNKKKLHKHPEHSSTTRSQNLFLPFLLCVCTELVSMHSLSKISVALFTPESFLMFFCLAFPMLQSIQVNLFSSTLHPNALAVEMVF